MSRVGPACSEAGTWRACAVAAPRASSCLQRDFGKRIRATHVARLPSGGAPEPGQVQPPSAIGEPAQILLTRTNCCQVPEPIPGGTCQQSVYGATGIEGTPTWQLAKPLECCNRPRDSMDKASAYGAGDCKSESCWGHFLISRVFTTLWATWYPASDTRHEVHGEERRVTAQGRGVAAHPRDVGVTAQGRFTPAA